MNQRIRLSFTKINQILAFIAEALVGQSVKFTYAYQTVLEIRNWEDAEVKNLRWSSEEAKQRVMTFLNSPHTRAKKFKVYFTIFPIQNIADEGVIHWVDEKTKNKSPPRRTEY